MFTVRDAESAMIALTSFSIAVIADVFLYNLLIVGNSTLKSVSVVLGNVSNILSAATLLTILEEGISLMFYRIRLALKEESEIKEQGRQETYQEVSDWKRKPPRPSVIANMILFKISVANFGGNFHGTSIPISVYCLQLGVVILALSHFS